ncbi:YhdP family protein, partial [Klebsiella aerogenes]
MRRWPGILLLTVATVVVIVALLVSGLRLALPQLNNWRPQLLEKITAVSGVAVDASQINANWENFGPTLDVRDIKATLKDGGEMTIKRVTLALDVWQSLLHMRWQFRDLTFWQLQIHTNTPIQTNDDGASLKTDRISDLFLRQFDHFILRDSHLSFLTISGQRAELAIPQLTWLNGKNRHRAEGQLSLSSLTGQHGVMQVRMDLRDENGLLNKGRLWLQADDIDVKPWLGRWMQDNIALQSARFSLEGWMTIDKGDVASGDVWLKKGGASWQGDKHLHQLSVDNLTGHITRENQSWAFHIPDTRISIDGKAWPRGELAMAWIPAQEVGGNNNQRSDELRIRASNLELGGLTGLQPMADKLAPSFGEVWRTTQPSGKINLLALDIPLQATEKCSAPGSSFHCFHARSLQSAWKRV